RMQAKGQYRNVFPSVHFKYSPRGNLVMRASYSNGIGRPPYGSIIPLNNANHEAETLTINNPALKPQYSDNFDVTAEYYFEPVGMVSAGVFLKELSSFIYQDRSQRVGYGADNGFGGLYENYEIITSSNGGAARYRGVELAY